MYLLNIVALLLSLLSGPYRDACPPRDYPWYDTSFSITSPPLPSGVTISPDSLFVGSWAITNTTSIPLYLFQRIDKPVWTPSDTEDIAVPNYQLIRKFVDGKVFYRQTGTQVWEEYPSPNPYGRNMLIGFSNEDPERLFAPMYQNLNPPTSKQRPDDVQAPQPQSTYILLSYDGKFIPAPITIRYSLNPHHQEFVERANSCGSGMWLLPVIMFLWTNPFCMLIIALLVFGSLIAWGIRANSQL